MSPPASPSPFAVALAASAHKLSRDSRNSDTKEAKRPRQSSPSSPLTSPSPSISSATTAQNTNPRWKGLRLTPTKRKPSTLFGDGEKRSSIAALANRTQRKVFSAGFFYAKKLKRFQKDSPSSPSRRRGTSGFYTYSSVVDLCSSDEGEDDEAPQKKTFASANDPSPRKNPTEKTRMASAVEAVGAGSTADASVATSLGSKSPPPVDLCSSDEEVSDEGVSEDDTDCAVAIASPKAPPPTLEKEYSIVGAEKKAKDPSTESQGAIQSLASEATLPSASATTAIANSNQREAASSPTRPSWKDFSKKLAERQSEILGSTPMDLAKKALVASHETKTGLTPSPSLELSLSTEQKRHLLDSLIPFGQSPEVIEATTTTTNEATKQQKETFKNEEPPVPDVGVGVGIDFGHPSKGEETAVEERQETESNFQWDGTFRFLPNTISVNSTLFCGNDYLRKENAESKPTNQVNNVHEGGITKGNEDDPSIDNNCDQPAAPCKESQNTENKGNKIELSVLLEQNVSDSEIDKPEDVRKGDGEATRGLKEANNCVENTIVGYGGDNCPIGGQESHPGDFNEARAVLGEVVTDIVDTVTSRCRQEQGQHSAEIETENLLDHAALEASSETDISAINLCEEENQAEKNRPLIVVSAKQLLLLALPLVCLAGIFRRLGLFEVSNSILEGCFRTFLQLHVLGSLLSPIFKHGVNYPGLVGCYALFMIVLASYEASSRTKYTHDAQFMIIVQSLVMNVGWVAMWAFGVILKPRPVWNPRYLLPIVGMLLGNSINGISITLDTIATSLVEKQHEVDLYLSFGANQYEAVSGIVAHAIQKGTTPSLNMMCVVGIVSIPGMMTGQILGGSSPLVAARYQAMIIFLIALSTLSTILMSSCLTVISAFCSHQILMPDRFVKNRKRGLARLILWFWGFVFGGGSDLIPVGSGGNSGGLLADDEPVTIPHPPTTAFEIRPLKKGSVVSDGEGVNSLVQASGLNRYFVVGDGSDEDTAAISRTNHRRVLFQDLSFRVNEGDLMLLSGPSGTGKSELLRMMAGLRPLQEGSLRLQGRSWNNDYNGKNVVEWRRQIRYVTQTKVHIPGTPLQFIKKIQSFRSWKAEDDRSDVVTDYDMMKHVSHHIRQWGMGLECLDKEWTVLSGGESQRVLMAIALASRPKVLLFDESTSALDHKSKLAVETSIKDFVEDHVGGVLWVSHDEQQAQRMMDDSDSIVVHGH